MPVRRNTRTPSRTVATALATVAAAGALTVLPAASPAAAGTTPQATAAAYTCSTLLRGGYWYAGHYDGMTVVPSAGVVTRAGIEAQCMLQDMGYYTGAIDGYFGPKSQDAMKRFQRKINQRHDAGLAVDGWPGPQSWPWLRR
ncbi:peptidoglycan-binding domain-containing protein [Streptomyces poriticola]|uniref:peptidoglycan-binding domain-containing protein n=1 Tax=Streptomyces poriticola TaxID=3120506 RepID=UPI002FCE0EE5